MKIHDCMVSTSRLVSVVALMLLVLHSGCTATGNGANSDDSLANRGHQPDDRPANGSPVFTIQFSTIEAQASLSASGVTRSESNTPYISLACSIAHRWVDSRLIFAGPIEHLTARTDRGEILKGIGWPYASLRHGRPWSVFGDSLIAEGTGIPASHYRHMHLTQPEKFTRRLTEVQGQFSVYVGKGEMRRQKLEAMADKEISSMTLEEFPGEPITFERKASGVGPKFQAVEITINPTVARHIRNIFFTNDSGEFMRPQSFSLGEDPDKYTLYLNPAQKISVVVDYYPTLLAYRCAFEMKDVPMPMYPDNDARPVTSVKILSVNELPEKSAATTAAD